MHSWRFSFLIESNSPNETESFIELTEICAIAGEWGKRPNMWSHFGLSEPVTNYRSPVYIGSSKFETVLYVCIYLIIAQGKGDT